MPKVILTNKNNIMEETDPTVPSWAKQSTKPTYTPSEIGAAPTSHGTHVSYSTTTPKAPGTATVGTETGLSRGDHIHPAQTSVCGNAGTATKLATGRTIQINLASTSAVNFDGTANITPGVTGVLPITNGGTGCSTEAAFKEKIQDLINLDVAIMWGSETAVGDATWWADLKAWLATSTAAQRQACLGKKKKVSLSTSLLGASQVTMMCVGYDIEKLGSLTFQSAYNLPTTFAFSDDSSKDSNGYSNGAKYIGSTAQTHCNNFANYCSASASLLQVTKQVCTIVNNNKTNAPDATFDCKCFLPSECEMGIGGTYSSSNSEWTVNGNQNIPYQYYTSNDTRKKFTGDANGNPTATANYYWLRSRYYGTSTSSIVCYVHSGGNAAYHAYTYASRLAPAFVIG